MSVTIVSATDKPEPIGEEDAVLAKRQVVGWLIEHGQDCEDDSTVRVINAIGATLNGAGLPPGYTLDLTADDLEVLGTFLNEWAHTITDWEPRTERADAVAVLFRGLAAQGWALVKADELAVTRAAADTYARALGSIGFVERSTDGEWHPRAGGAARMAREALEGSHRRRNQRSAR